MLAIAKAYRTALKALMEFHQDNLCNIARGESGCYCLELKKVLVNKMGDAISV
jgi:hypothetical protein